MEILTLRHFRFVQTKQQSPLVITKKCRLFQPISIQIINNFVEYVIIAANGFCCVSPYLVCASPYLSRVSNSNMKYSTSYSYVYGYKARLHNSAYWGVRSDDALAVLKIDFGPEKVRMTAMAVQSGSGYFVSAYELSYSVDGWSWRYWIENGSEKVLKRRNFCTYNHF